MKLSDDYKCTSLFFILISLHPFVFSVMIAPADLRAPALRPLNTTAMKVSWDAPAELNGPPPLYHVERTDVSLSDAQGQVIRGRRFTGSGYFRFPSSTLPVNTDFTGMGSQQCCMCLKIYDWLWNVDQYPFYLHNMVYFQENSDIHIEKKSDGPILSIGDWLDCENGCNFSEFVKLAKKESCFRDWSKITRKQIIIIIIIISWLIY